MTAKKPTPYYQDDFATIYHGDCRDIIPHLGTFDLLLTDPPYGIGEANGKNKSRTKIAKAKDYGKANWDNERIDIKLIHSIRSLCKSQIIFGGNYYDLPPTSCFFVWDKDNGQNDFADAELAWTNLKQAVRLKKYRWNGMLQENMKNKEFREHPTQKPMPIMQWCINQAGDVVSILDPFMGSGTTLVAAKNLNRKAVGIELEEKYCEIAAKRLSQGVFNFGT